VRCIALSLMLGHMQAAFPLMQHKVARLLVRWNEAINLDSRARELEV